MTKRGKIDKTFWQWAISHNLHLQVKETMKWEWA